MTRVIQNKWVNWFFFPVTWSIVIGATLFAGLYVLVSSYFMPRALGERLISYIPRIWSGLMLAASMSRIRVIRFQKDQPHPRVYMSNHQSLGDIPCLMLALPMGFRFLSKKEVFGVPVMGFCMRQLRYISIDRKNKVAAIASIERAADIIRHESTSVWISPEGTRSADGTLGPFKKGPFHLASKARVPIVPVWIIGTRDLLPKHSLVFGQRPMLDVIIGKDITEHMEQELSLDDLSDLIRKKLLELKESYDRIEARLPPHRLIGAIRLDADSF